MTSRFVCVALCTRHSSCLRRGCRLHCCYWLYCWLSKVFSLPSHSVRIEMWDDKLCHITNTLTITNVRCHLTFDVGVPFQNKTICKQLWMFRKRRRQKINIYTYTYIYLDNIAVRVCMCVCLCEYEKSDKSNKHNLHTNRSARFCVAHERLHKDRRHNVI